MEGLVQGLCFAPAGRDLAIAAEQNTVDIWDLGDASKPREKLVLARHATTPDVSLSPTGVAFCSGTIFSTMGIGPHAPSWRDSLEFEVAQATLTHPRALNAALRLKPTLVNMVHPISGESILQYAVRKKSRSCVDQLLRARCAIGPGVASTLAA